MEEISGMLGFTSPLEFSEWIEELTEKPSLTNFAKHLRFNSSADSVKLTSFEKYISRMKPQQSHIFYLDQTQREKVEISKVIKSLLVHGCEVLYMDTPVAHIVTSSLAEFNGKILQNIAENGFVKRTLGACKFGQLIGCGH